ncbi:MAG: methyltransferase [Campylobacteraceae bacterium]|nr:methyltransferase [Campylobacteraceae bacterium]MBT3882983.1 methyltransferase [Campylobacteraceae bacterium]MBT4030533.1 methyltransferase [Campylobacteraceae bacterium]MBT4179544.1 methyltransferase [Campylobacteraceae bacterium]MBT4572223.1 methyltransferase [Campylobacteraceae bacterium]
MTLYQPENGYCYNSDTHLLFQFICDGLDKFKNINGSLLDIGSGSGILGLLVAREFSKLSLNQCEIQDIFEFLSLKNSQINNISTTMHKGSILDMEFDKQFDIIVSNPPFYHSQVVKSQNENIKIARYNDNMPLKNFIMKTSKILTANGKFFFCYDAKQINEIISICKDVNLNIEAIKFLHPKDNKNATIVMIYARKNSKSLMQIYPPFIMFDNGGEFKQEILDIYVKCSTHSIKVNMELVND